MSHIWFTSVSIYLYNCENLKLLPSLMSSSHHSTRGRYEEWRLILLDAFIHTHITSSRGKLRCQGFFTRLNNSDVDNRKGENDVTHLEVKNKKATAPMKDAAAVVFFSDHLSQQQNNCRTVSAELSEVMRSRCLCLHVRDECLFVSGVPTLPTPLGIMTVAASGCD